MLNPNSLAFSSAACRASRFDPIITFLTLLKMESPGFGVSSILLLSPFSKWEYTDFGILSWSPYFLMIFMQSEKVVLSGAVGPDAIESSLFPITSDNIRVSTGEGWATSANLPPLTLEMCFRIVLISLISAPHLKNSLVSDENTIVDLGEDEFTVGRLHPMMDNTLRIQRLHQEAEDPEVAVILLDVVLGYGSHPDPASELARNRGSQGSG